MASDDTEWPTITLLLIGGCFAGIAWLRGVFLLWRSSAWTVRNKLIGTLLWPGGLVTGLAYGSSYLIQDDDSGDLGLIAVVVAILVPVATADLPGPAGETLVQFVGSGAVAGSSPEPRGRSDRR